MRYMQLGNTGLLVSELCFGTMTFGGRGFWTFVGSRDQKAADRLVRQALDAGINFIDTADVYSEGLSESMLGASLAKLGIARKDIVLATKFHGVTGPGPNDRGGSAKHIRDAVAASLKRLGTDHIDLYQIHGFDRITPMEETLRALDDLVRAGMVRYIGCSNWAAWQIMKAIGISQSQGWSRFVTLQAYYSIAGRDLERELVPLVMDQRLGLMVWSPLAGGLLADKAGVPGTRRSQRDFPPVDAARAERCIRAMRKVATRHGVSVARVALAWLLAKEHVSSVIVGAKTPEQLADNIAATTLSLSAREVAALDAVSALPPEYPAWMIAVQGQNRRPAAFEPAGSPPRPVATPVPAKAKASSKTGTRGQNKK